MSTRTNDTPAPAAADTSTTKHIIPDTAIVVTERCYLRPFEVSDAEALAQAANDTELAKYMRNRFPSPYALSDAQGWIDHCRAGRAQSLGIFTVAAGEYAGSITLELPTGDKIYAGTRELGYFLARKFWGRGFMSEVVRGLTRWAFATSPELLRIEATTFAPNVASQSVLRKAGFVKEGTRRLAIVKNGEQIDEVIFGLIRTDIEA